MIQKSLKCIQINTNIRKVRRLVVTIAKKCWNSTIDLSQTRPCSSSFNKSVNITIFACWCSKAAVWIMNSFQVICTRSLANALHHLLYSAVQQKMEHWTTNQQLWYLYFLFCFFQPLQVLILVLHTLARQALLLDLAWYFNCRRIDMR